jgi:ATP-dependent 26S proteasome regulatory subunit
MATDEVIGRTRLLDNEIKIMKSEVMRISHELQAQNDKIKDNTEKIKVNKTLPYLVSNVIEVCMYVHYTYNHNHTYTVCTVFNYVQSVHMT